MEIKQMVTPEIVAVTTAREAADRNRALGALSDQRSLGESIFFGLLLFAAAAPRPLLLHPRVVRAGAFAMLGVELCILVAVGVGAEGYHLRRRVKAITLLLLQRDRAHHEP